MNIMISDITAMSSKGQVVLPKTIRDAMSLEIGSKFMVLSDGTNIVLQPIKYPDISEFSALMDDAKTWAKKVGMDKSDINNAIKSVRKNKSKK